MRINRKFLYWGTFLVALGGVLVATDLAAIDSATLTDALRLWPLAVIVIGLGVVLRRNPQLSLSTGMLAAAVPGLMLGGAFAVAPRFTGDCGNLGNQATTQGQEGSFDGPASVSVNGGCGSITINTAPGRTWHLDAANTLGRTADVRSSPRSLLVESTGGDNSSFFSGGRDTWALTLPTSEIDDLAVVVSAGIGQVDLPGARIGRLTLTASLSQVAVDASQASVTNLSGAVNLGLLSIQLPTETDLVGSLQVGGGVLQVCSSPGVGLRVIATGSPREVTVEDVEEKASEWQSPDYATAPHHAEILVHVSFGSVEINPIGGCK